MPHRTLTASIAAMGVLALGLAGTSAAAPDPNADIGQRIASCAQESLGPREDPPTVTCTHLGTTMTFPTFGAMVEHLREMHGS